MANSKKKNVVTPSAPPEVIPEVQASKYRLVLTMGDKIVAGEGDSVLEILEKIERPLKITTKVMVTGTYDDKSFVQMLFPDRAKRLFYKVSRPVIAKQLQLLLR